jgi:hypothetical protein
MKQVKTEKDELINIEDCPIHQVEMETGRVNNVMFRISCPTCGIGGMALLMTLNGGECAATTMVKQWNKLVQGYRKEPAEASGTEDNGSLKDASTGQITG